MEYYDIGKDIIAFTTDRSIGRDEEKVRAELSGQPPLSGGARRELRFARPHQTHTDKILNVSDEFFDLPGNIRQLLLQGIDAVITRSRYTILGVSTADCIPVIVYDPVHHAAAAIHAGWKGTVRRIVQKVINEMHLAFRTNAEDCLAVIGPGISLDSFEVGAEVVDAFVEAGLIDGDTDPMRENALLSYYRRNGDTFTKITAAEDIPTGKPHLNLKRINLHQLLKAGLRSENITISPIDTFTNPDFFSARREQAPGGEKCGRMLTGFVLADMN